MSTASFVVRVRIGSHVLALPAAKVARVGRIDQAGWAGRDADGGPLWLANTAYGPVIAISASRLLHTELDSASPAWAVVLQSAGRPLLGAAVCDVLGLAEGIADADLRQTPPEVASSIDLLA